MNIKELIDRNGGEAIAFGEGWKTHKCGKCLACNANPAVRPKVIYRVFPKGDGIFIRLYVANVVYELLKDTCRRIGVGTWIEDGDESGVEMVVQEVGDVAKALNKLYDAYQKALRV